MYVPPAFGHGQRPAALDRQERGSLTSKGGCEVSTRLGKSVRRAPQVGQRCRLRTPLSALDPVNNVGLIILVEVST
jgi:hypothetical protein